MAAAQRVKFIFATFPMGLTHTEGQEVGVPLCCRCQLIIYFQFLFLLLYIVCVSVLAMPTAKQPAKGQQDQRRD